MGINNINGGSIIAMAGEKCVAIASDKKLSVQFQAVSGNFQRIFPITQKTYLGCTGLATDVQTLYLTLRFHSNLFALREARTMKPETFANFLAHQLYQRKFAPWFVSPVVAGLKDDDEPYLACSDIAGNLCTRATYVASGSAEEQIMGACEHLWRPNMSPEELFETCAQALLASTHRDIMAGCGAVVYLITPDEVIMRELEMRTD